MIKLRKANKYDKLDFPKAVATITIGRHEAILTQKDINNLYNKLNRFAIPNVNNWVSCDEQLPKHLQTVWLANAKTQWVSLGCLVGNDDQTEGEYNYHWAESNGNVYMKNGVIISECESDDLEVTHWCPLPKPPCS